MPYIDPADLADSPWGTERRTTLPNPLPDKVCVPSWSGYALKEEAERLEKKRQEELEREKKKQEVS